MKKLIAISMVCFLATNTLLSQDSISRRGFTANIEYRYLYGKIYHHFNDKKFDWNSATHDNSLRIYAGYFFTPKINLNLGTGIDANTTAARTILQAKYYFSEKKHSFFLASEGAYLFSKRKIAAAPFHGYELALFAGKELSISKYFAFNFHIGYSYNKTVPKSRALAYGNDFARHEVLNNSEHTLLLGVAFVFK